MLFFLHLVALRYQKGGTYHAYFDHFTLCTYCNVISDLHIWLVKISIIEIHQLMMDPTVGRSMIYI